MKPARKQKQDHFAGVNIRFEDCEEAGLENLGNSCYINSVINCLTSLNYLQYKLQKQGMEKTRKFIYCLQKIKIFMDKNEPNKAIKYVKFIRQVPQFQNSNFYKI